MNIALDMSFIARTSGTDGIDSYAKHLIKYMLHTPSSHSFFCFYPNMEHGEEHLKQQLGQFLLENQIDMFLLISPFDFPNQAIHKDWFGETKLSAVLTDQYEPSLKETYSQMLEFIKTCDVVIALSKSSKKDAIQYAGFNPMKIVVIKGAAGDSFRKFETTDADTKFLSSFGITKPYILCTNRNDSYINHDGLIEAFNKANWGFDQQYQLVIRQQESYGINNPNVIYTGNVTVNDWVKLLNGSEIFVSPSYYESSGIPVLEAMACGVPVISSSIPTLDEFTGHAALRVDPNSVEQLTNAIIYLLANPSEKEAYSEKSLEQAKQFDWAASASVLINRFNKLEMDPALSKAIADPEADTAADADAETARTIDITLNETFSHPQLTTNPNIRFAKSANSLDSATPSLSDEPDASSPEAAAAPDENAEENTTIRLTANRYKRVKRGKQVVLYVSFNLSELPPQSVIHDSRLEIPVNNSAKAVAVHRIKDAWSARSFRRKRPLLWRLPIYKTSVSKKKKTECLYWHCTEVAKNWSSNHLTNHGVCLFAATKKQRPALLVTIGSK